jgi:hypothetical protein
MNRTRPAVPLRKIDRLWDLLALLLLLTGVTSFGVGRFGLSSLGSGTHAAPDQGMTWVVLAERHDAQARWGLWLVGIGVAIALLSALMHALRHRRALDRDG